MIIKKPLSLCPNCESNENVSLHAHTAFNKSGNFWVECSCGAHGEECDNPVDAILYWGVQEIEQLQARIKELESEDHVNDIKAQGIANYLENDLLQYVNSYDVNYGVSVDHIESEIKKLRAKHE